MRCENLCRVYRQGSVTVHAVRDVSFALRPREMACVLGRSGSGKSTLLHLLGCLDRPTTGEVWIGGVHASACTDRERVRLRRTRLGFVFQMLNLLGSMTAEENVALPLRYAGLPRGRRLERARAMLDRVGLSTRRGFTPDRLSGGEQQRVALARALVTEPALVLADEPTGDLDTATAAEMQSLFVEINREHGTAFLIVTHDERMAECASRVFRMTDGVLSED